MTDRPPIRTAPPAEDLVPLTVNCPRSLYEALLRAADAAKVSRQGFILARLQSSLAVPPSRSA